MAYTDEEVRWRIVLTWKDGKETGIDAKQVASIVKVSRRVAERWIQRYKDTGTVECLPKSGRKHTLTKEAEREAYKLLIEEKHGPAKVVARELVNRNINDKLVHKITIIRAARRVAEETGTGPLRALRGKPRHELSERTIGLRVRFCKGRLRRTWKVVMFSDRKRFHWSYPKAKLSKITWAKKGEKRTARGVNHPRCVNVYGGLTFYGVTKLHIVTGTSNLKTKFTNGRGQVAKNITKGEYAVVLKETLLPEGVRIFSGQGTPNWCFQQDNDPAHKDAKHIIQEYMDEHGNVIDFLPSWPPSSPDLSPIENLWGLVQTRLDERGCETFEEFKQALHEEWLAVGNTHAKELVSSATKRTVKCIDLGGKRTGY